MQTNSEQKSERSDLSIVELTVIVVRWKKLFFSVFLLLSCATGLYAFVSPDKQASIGVYQLTKTGEGKFLTNPAAVVSTMASVWIPELVLEYERKGQSVPDVEVMNPDATGLIQLRTVATMEDEDLVVSLHTALLERLGSWQLRVVKDYVSRMELRVARHTSVIEQVKEEDGAGEALAMLLEKKIQLESALDQIEKGEILSVVSRGKEKINTSKKLILVVGFLMAFVAGVVLTFFAEFIGAVRKSMMEKS